MHPLVVGHAPGGGESGEPDDGTKLMQDELPSVPVFDGLRERIEAMTK
jgi:hypothetical protein